MVIGAMDFFSLWFGECVNYCWFICQFQWVALNKLNSHSNRWRVPINTSYRLYYYEWCKKKIDLTWTIEKNAMSRKPSKKGPRENTHTSNIYWHSDATISIWWGVYWTPCMHHHQTKIYFDCRLFTRKYATYFFFIRVCASTWCFSVIIRLAFD